MRDVIEQEQQSTMTGDAATASRKARALDTPACWHRRLGAEVDNGERLPIDAAFWERRSAVPKIAGRMLFALAMLCCLAVVVVAEAALLWLMFS